MSICWDAMRCWESEQRTLRGYSVRFLENLNNQMTQQFHFQAYALKS